MKKHVLIKIILVLVILGVSFWNFQQQHENLSLKESVEVQEKSRIVFKEREKELQQENELLKEEIKVSSEALKKMREGRGNIEVDEKNDLEFIDVVTKLFEANLNFTPKNFIDKKKEVSSYLSDELKKSYFGQDRNTYQDANGVTSKLESLEIYPKREQKINVDGVVVCFYLSKMDNQVWNKDTIIFRVTYNSESKKVTRITNLGRGNHISK